MQAVSDFFSTLSGYLWGWPMIILLVGTHLYLTIRLRFPQKNIFKAIKLSFANDDSAKGDISQFSSLTTSLAATIGTGNIIGVATAVSLGGPGAVFWCWVAGILGMATKYTEGLLAIKYRVMTKDGKMLGGPMYAIERGLGWKWLAVLFCIFTFLASFGIGCSVQSNAIAVILNETCGVNPLWTGIILALMVSMVVVFGLKGISNVCRMIVPVMASIYIVGCIAVLIFNGNVLGATFATIFKCAFTPEAATGGFVGGTIMVTLRYGIARGLFSNESGMGSAPIIAAASKTRNPVRQALVSSTSVFWDTVVVCLLTGLVVVSSMIATGGNISGKEGLMLTQESFGRLPLQIGNINFGSFVVNSGVILFAFSTLVGWCYYGEKAIEYLFGAKHYRKVRLCYRILWVIVTFAGSIWSISFVWNIGDVTNALMAIPNLICILLLSPIAVSETRKYLWNKKLDEFSDDDIPTLE